MEVKIGWRFGRLKTVQVPEDWNSINKRQLLEIADSLTHEAGGVEKTVSDQYDAEKLFELQLATRIRVIRSLLNISWSKMTAIEPDQLIDLYPLADFIYSTDNTIELTKTHMDKFIFRGQVYHGPADLMDRLTLLELTTADTYFVRSVNDNAKEYLPKLCAILYREPKSWLWLKKARNSYNGDPRCEYFEHSTEIRTEIFKELPNKYKAAIWYTYWGFRMWMVNQFENLFPKPKEGVKPLERVGNNYGWAGTLLELSGGKFGTYDATTRIPWKNAFVEMSRLRDEQILMKEAQDEAAAKARANARRR